MFKLYMSRISSDLNSILTASFMPLAARSNILNLTQQGISGVSDQNLFKCESTADVIHPTVRSDNPGPGWH